MNFVALTATAPPPRQLLLLLLLSVCCFLRGLCCQVKVLHFVLVLLFTFLCLPTFGPWQTDGMQKSADLAAFGPGKDDCGTSSPDIVIADSSLGYAAGNPTAHASIESVCANSHSFCFLSTLLGFSSKENRIRDADLEATRSQYARPLSLGSTWRSQRATNESWSSDSGTFGLLNGQTVSCFLDFRESIDELSPLQIQTSKGLWLNKNSEMQRSSSFDLSSSSHVEISPPVLDWGQNYLYVFSVAYLTVANTFNESILHVYEPFSTNIQFYPCDFSELSLGPGERASICFVFLPRWLGLSSAHLILQTSTGGFVVQAKGYAVESPYVISPLLNLGPPSHGRLSKNLSLFDPFNETVYVKEISAQILVSQGNDSHQTEASCRSENFQDSELLHLLSTNDWLVVKSGQVDFPLMAIRPHEIWELSLNSSETISEMDFSFESEGKIFGAICMQMLRSSQVKSEKLVIPLEIDPNSTYDDITGPVSTSLEALVPRNANSTKVVAISVRNRAPQLLKVVDITEVAGPKIFLIKHSRGLLLLPGSVTKVATVTCTQLHAKLFVSPPEMLHMNKNCKLVVLTNDSHNPEREIPCEEIIRTCFRQQEYSGIGYDHHSENAAVGTRRTGSLDNRMQMPSNIKALETDEEDVFVLGNWKSQGTASSMSVLDDNEVLFPMVQVGTHASKWISVKNPSHKPVLMQLILNSGEIIDECRGKDSFLEAPSISVAQAKLDASVRHGFSTAESALTEASVLPHGKASFGPIFFHPSSRCMWKSSALIGNNLSGVEWVSLLGFGVSPSLLMLEGSETVHTVEFNLNSVVPPDTSPLGILFHIKDISYACSQQLSKELYAKNIGDLPLVVTRIEVSGTECGLDGFMVHSCKGFSLERGESKKLLISFHAEHCESMVQTDLKLVLDGGILVIPMKASLPLYMMNFCRKSVLWIQVKKFLLAVFLPASLIFLILYCIFFQVVALGFQGNSYGNAKSSLGSAKSAGKPSRIQPIQKNSKLSVLDCMDYSLRLPREDKSTKWPSTGRYRGNHDGEAEEGMISQDVAPRLGCYKQVDSLLYNEKDKADPLLSSKTIAVENATIVEDSQSHYLTVRTGKEKGRKRRKRKGTNAGLKGLFEISSSQSGNSTPSSPSSPATSVTPKPTLIDSTDMDPIQSGSPFSQVADCRCGKFQFSKPASVKVGVEPRVSLSCTCFSSAQEQPSVSRQQSVKPVLLPSATFPCTSGTASSLLDSSSAAPASTIAPYARAPGPKQKTVKLEGKVEDKYTYDIWGDHFSGLNLVGSPKNVTTMKTITTENNSNSFFVRGPLVLVTKSQPKYVSCFQQQR